MIGRVPIARRALFQDRRRAALAAGGVASALLLVLLLQGIFDGAMEQVTTYIRNAPADVFVSGKDVRTMHMSVSALPPATPATVERVDGVAWAEGIRYTTTFVSASGGGRQLSYVIGYDPATGRGGPRRMTSGRPPGTGEVTLEEVAARRLGVRRGDTVIVFGDRFRVSGLFHGGTTIVNSVAFITSADFAARSGPTIAYVLVGARPGVSAKELAARVAAALPADTVQTRARFAHEEASLIKDMSADVIRIMSTVGFLIALAVVALTLFTLTLAKMREYAIVKALGGRPRRIAGIVVAQAAWSVTVAAALAAVLAIVVGAIVGRLNPAVTIAVEPRSVLRVGLAALLIGAIGALVPLVRVVAVDPASAFRRES